MITAMKFGGSILSNKADLERVAKIVKQRSRNEGIAIVVSALKGVTDQLIGAAYKSLEDSKAVEGE